MAPSVLLLMLALIMCSFRNEWVNSYAEVPPTARPVRFAAELDKDAKEWRDATYEKENAPMTKTTDTETTKDLYPNGLRTLEIASAVSWLAAELVERLRSNPQRVSTVGVRSQGEQELLGLVQVLLVMYPFAIEIALKSLWDCLHTAQGGYEYIHNLGKLFDSLSKDAKDEKDAERAQDEARKLWRKFQPQGETLDDFLKAHADDFRDIRYYSATALKHQSTRKFEVCLLCIIDPLSRRDQETGNNLLRLIERGKLKLTAASHRLSARQT